MTKTILDFSCDFNDQIKLIHLAFQDLGENFVDIVRITSIDCDFERFVIFLDLEIEGDLFHDLLLVKDQESGEVLLVLVLGKFS